MRKVFKSALIIFVLCSLFISPVYAKHKHYNDHRNIFSSVQDLRSAMQNNNLSINYTDEDNENLLMKAIKYRANIDVIQELINLGVNINAQDEDGETALMKALDENSSIETIKLLIKSGANLNLQDEDGETALMYAIDDRDSEIINLLLDSGADVNIRDRKGRNAADYARHEYKLRNSEVLNKILSAEKK